MKKIHKTHFTVEQMPWKKEKTMRYFIIVDGTVEDTADSEKEATGILKAKLKHEDPRDVEVAIKVPVLILPSGEVHFKSLFSD